MGAGTSIETHQQLFDQTTQTRDVMNILLEYMLREISVRDFVSMTNPEECKKYVMFMANHLYQHFYELRVTPLRDRHGILVFRKIKELVDPQDQKDKEEKQSLCLILAYFYTRIFQIYGALALTVIDDANFMVSSGATSVLQPQGRALEPRGYRPYYMQGGANIGNFNFLRGYLNSEKEYEGFRTRYPNVRVPIFFNTRVITDDSAISDSEIQEGTFLIGTGGSKPSKLKVTAGRSSFGAANITMKIGELRYYKKKEKEKEWEERTATIPETTLRDKKMEFVPSDYQDTGKTATYLTRGGDSLAEYFNKLFDRLIPYLQTLTETSQITDYGIKDDEKKTYSEEGTVKELRLGRMISNLRDQRPLGHCIARALQLLQQLPVSKEFVSNVCNVKFSEARSTQRTSTGKTVIIRPGLPSADSSLQDNAGLAMTELLFYDAIAVGSPKLLISDRPIDGRKSSLEQYIDFMRRMAALFGDDPNREVSAIRSSGLSGIKNKRDGEICKGTQAEIRISPGVAGQVQTIVRDMFRIQYEHTKACGDIIRMLFDIKKDSNGRTSISLSERIIKLGFPEIERINHAARELLMKYYSNCEARYVQGMAVVVQSKRQGEAQAQVQAQQQVKPQQTQGQVKPQQTQVQGKPQGQAPQTQAEAQVKQAHQQLLSQHRQQLESIVKNGSQQVKPLANTLLNYLSKLHASPIIPEYTYLMISYLGIPHDADNTRVIRENLLRFQYTPQEIDRWNNQKQMMDRNLTRIFFTNDSTLPFYLFSFLSNNPFTDPRDPEKVWKTVSSYYLYQLAVYRNDTPLATSLKDGTKLTEAQRGIISGWLQNTSTDFRTYQRRAMYRGNLLKFVNPSPSDPKNMRAIILCSTINRELVFADKDPYWGIGNKDPSTIASPFNDGNHLGKILMELRTQLFTSSRSQIDKFLKGDATKPSGSTAVLNSSFLTNI